MADIFLMYDFIGNSMVESHNIGTIIRLLGCAPTEKECKEFIQLAEFKSQLIFCLFENFKQIMKKILI